MAIQTGSEAVDFPSLTLDTAIQLDRLQNHKSADLGVITRFSRYLESPSGYTPAAGVFALSENPVNVEIVNSALYGVEGARPVSMGELEDRLRILVLTASDVGSGRAAEEGIILGLKRFCLSLHRVLLDEITPAADEEWMSINDARPA